MVRGMRFVTLGRRQIHSSTVCFTMTFLLVWFIASLLLGFLLAGVVLMRESIVAHRARHGTPLAAPAPPPLAEPTLSYPERLAG